MTPKTRLQAVRKQLGYSADDVIRMIGQRAERLHVPVMTPTSLKTKLSRWENGHESVSEPYRRLFREVYGRTDEEMGFPSEPDDEDVAELRARLAVARRVDPEMVEVFRRQVDYARQVDRTFGGITTLDQLRGNIDHVGGLLGYSTSDSHREALS